MIIIPQINFFTLCITVCRKELHCRWFAQISSQFSNYFLHLYYQPIAILRINLMKTIYPETLARGKTSGNVAHISGKFLPLSFLLILQENVSVERFFQLPI